MSAGLLAVETTNCLKACTDLALESWLEAWQTYLSMALHFPSEIRDGPRRLAESLLSGIESFHRLEDKVSCPNASLQRVLLTMPFGQGHARPILYGIVSDRHCSGQQTLYQTESQRVRTRALMHPKCMPAGAYGLAKAKGQGEAGRFGGSTTSRGGGGHGCLQRAAGPPCR